VSFKWQEESRKIAVNLGVEIATPLMEIVHQFEENFNKIVTKYSFGLHIF